MQAETFDGQSALVRLRLIDRARCTQFVVLRVGEQLDDFGRHMVPSLVTLDTEQMLDMRADNSLWWGAVGRAYSHTRGQGWLRVTDVVTGDVLARECQPYGRYDAAALVWTEVPTSMPT